MTVSCNNCNSDNYVTLPKVKCLYSGELLSVVKCSNCDLVYLNPRPDKNLGLAYFEEAYSNAPGFEDHDYYRNHDQIFRRNKMRLDTINKLKSPNRKVLDFGAGQGHFVKTACDNGWEGSGVELSAAAIQAAKENFDLNLLDSVEKSDIRDFGVIALWDVIEHLEDPKQTLMELEKYLHPEGFFVIETSNIDSTDYLALKEKWGYWHVDHLYYYSRKTLNYLFDTLGFKSANMESGAAKAKKTRKEKIQKYKAIFLNFKNLVSAVRKKILALRFKNYEQNSLMFVAFQRK